MKLDQFLADLAQRHIELHAEDGDLVYTAPKDSLTEDDLTQLRAHKQAILDRLTRPTRLRPLSQAQRRLWIMHQLEPMDGAYIIPAAVRLRGPLDCEALNRALTALMKRHEPLRTRIVLKGSEPQLFVEDQVHCDLHPEDIAEEALQDALSEQANANFDFVNDLPFRTRLFRLGDDDHVLQITSHHLALDGYSIGIVTRDLFFLYAAELGQEAPYPLPRLSACYSDFVQAETVRELTLSDATNASRSRWIETLEGALSPLSLPYDQARADAAASSGQTLSFSIEPSDLKAMHALAVAQKTTVFAILSAVFAIALSRVSGQTQIPLTTAVSDRANAHFENLAGNFSNTILIPHDVIPGARFADSLAQMSKTISAALDVQDLPFENIVRALSKSGGYGFLSRPQVMVLYENTAMPMQDIAGLNITPIEIFTEFSKFDLGLYLSEDPSGLKAILEYASDVFDRATVDALMASFKGLLHQVVQDPDRRIGDLSGRTWTKEDQIGSEWTPPGLDMVHDRIFRIGQDAPDQLAIIDIDDTEITFGALANAARGFALDLCRDGVKQGDRVVILAEKSAKSIAAILGCLTAGAAFVPLDPRTPEARLDHQIKAAGGKVVCQDADLAHLFQPRADLDEWTSLPLAEGQEAYVIFTSGSSGLPKGVSISHGAFRDLGHALDQTIYDQSEAELRIGMEGPLHFDTSLKQLVQLGFGRSIVLPAATLGFDPKSILARCAQHRIDVLDTTPAKLPGLLNAGLASSGHPRVLLVAGEPVGPELWRSLARCTALEAFNLYGPTECTVDATVAKITESMPHIGHPLPGVSVDILSEEGMPLAPTEVGEIAISGWGVALGYLDQPEEAAKRFVPAARSPDTRCFLTGDFGRRMPDGRIQYIGRKDEQVKLNGFRIDLFEIEGLLAAHENVSEAMVQFRPQSAGRARLAARVVPHPNHRDTVAGQKRHALPNGLAVNGINASETDFLYDEIFIKNAYLRHGINLDQDGAVFDVGSNIGLFSIAVSALNPEARIVAIEPVPRTANALRANLALYAGKADVFETAIGPAAGYDQFTHYPRLSILSGVDADEGEEKSLVASYLKTRRGAAGHDDTALDALLDHELTPEIIDVDVTPLGEIISRAGVDSIALLKINVEKAEEDVLESIWPEQWPMVRQVALEIHDDDGRLERISRLLQEKGFFVHFEQDWSVGPEQGIYYLYAKREAFSHLDATPQPLPPIAAEFLTKAKIINSDDISEYLKAHLPQDILPGRIFIEDSLPLTANGKRDRNAALPQDKAAPQTRRPAKPGLEQKIAEIWESLLPDAAPIDRFSKFYDIGGDSLLLLDLHTRIDAKFPGALILQDLFEHSSIAAIAAHISGGAVKQQRVSPIRSDPVSDDVAIIGMACRVPGANNLEAFWNLLTKGETALQRFSLDEMLAAGVDAHQVQSETHVPVGGVIPGIGQFDASFFGFSPSDAIVMDPQQRIFLETVWHAMEDANCVPETVNHRIGLFAGSSLSTYLLNNLWADQDLVSRMGPHRLLVANDKDHLATQTSYRLGLTGPSIAVQTACSSSLVAVSMACDALTRGDCDIAIAGGVSLRVPQRAGYPKVAGGIGAPNGMCRPFDADAEGTVGGNGTGVVVLRRWSDASAAGDPIRARIKGWAINNDGGAKIGYTAPSIEGQTEVIQAALARAGLSGSDIDYVEAHGTGTPLGDPIEIKALTRAFGTARETGEKCALGAVKGNIGHLDAAAGIVGLIKATLMVDRGQIVPSGSFNSASPAIDFETSPFQVAQETRPWPDHNSGAKRAAVSSFGIGGTNAHVVIDNGIEVSFPQEGSASVALLAWSGQDQQALERHTTQLRQHLSAQDAQQFADIAATAWAGRVHHKRRRALVAESTVEAAHMLSQGNWIESTTAHNNTRIGFLLPGQGSVSRQIGAQLYQHDPVFQKAFDDIAKLARQIDGRDLHGLLTNTTAPGPLPTGQAQPLIAALSCAVAARLVHSGIYPSAVLGHSLGDLVACHLAESFDLETLMNLVITRATLMQAAPRGVMLSVHEDPGRLAPLLKTFDLDLAAHNGPGLSVVSGPEATISQFEAQLENNQVKTARLATSHAFHSRMMQDAAVEFDRVVNQTELCAPRIAVISSATGKNITSAQEVRDAISGAQIRNTVAFDAALRSMAQFDNMSWVEVGPGRHLTTLAKTHDLAQQSVLAPPTLAKGSADEARQLQNSIAALWVHGATLDPDSLAKMPRRARFPSYPFAKTFFWCGTDEVDDQTTQSPDTSEPDPNVRVLQDDVEIRLLAIWQDVLGIPDIHPESDFFELGGHSLLAAEIFDQISQIWSHPLPLSAVFEATTVAELAAVIRATLDVQAAE